MSGLSSEATEARRTLRSRGYLEPPPPPAPSRSGLWWGLWTAAYALDLALVAAGTGGGSFWGWVSLAAALVPACAGALGAAWVGIGWLTRRLVLWGVEPKTAATAGAWLAAAATLAAVVASVGRAGTRPPGWLGVGLGLVLAGLAFRWARAQVGESLHLAEGRGVALGVLAAFALVTAALGSWGFFWPAPREPRRAAPPPVFPHPQGRVAVVAVDSLSREDVEAMAQLLGGGWETLARWSWGPLEAGEARFPTEFWTTVACGAPPARHGVTVLEETRPFGTPWGVALPPLLDGLVAVPWAPLGLAPKAVRPTLDRQLPTFWEMAAAAGYPVTVVGWWGSWPVRLFAGQVVSERALLSGATGEDAVAPTLAPLVRSAWGSGSHPAERAGRITREVAERACAQPGPQLLVLGFLPFDLETRATPSSPLALAARQLPHARVFGELVVQLERSGFEIFIVGAAWRGGRWFWAASRGGGSSPPLPATGLAPLVLRALHLPPAREHRGPGNGGGEGAVAYGPPPPPVGVPGREVVHVQREVLRSLGYLQ